MNKYEALIVLDAAAKEESIKEALDRVQKEIETTGGHVETIQKMGPRPLARNMNARSSGFYANVIFTAPPKAIHELDTKFHLDTDILRWQITDFVPEPVRKRRIRPETASVQE